MSSPTVDRFVRIIHLVSGIATVVAFLGTGLYMRENFPEVYELNEIIRYQFRANHIYLLLSGLLNVALGLYLALADDPKLRFLQRSGSTLPVAAPVLFLLAFFLEPPNASPQRPLTFVAVLISLIGVVLHLVGAMMHRRQTAGLSK